MIERWFQQQGWAIFDFQRETWQAYLNGESGIIHAPTGVGKTYAAWMGPILEWLAEHPDQKEWRVTPEPLRVLWITPMRALAYDTHQSLNEPIQDLKLPWTVELRTGDTSSSARKRQREKNFTALITTPESLSLLLSYPDAKEKFQYLRCIVVDEWHELLQSKRGIQTELCLARLRTWLPPLRVWGLSATLENVEHARSVLLGENRGRMVHAPNDKRIEIRTLIPDQIERFPWSGHLGLKLLPQVVEAIGQAKSTLLFTNTRSQAEIWYQALIDAVPDWAGEMALHHGSIDKELRVWVENQIRASKLRCVVCTASMDLGVDFSPVDQVIQVGSPKGIARLKQRAGRSGHQPGAVSRIVCVPTHAFEILEYAAARDALRNNHTIDTQKPEESSTLALDVLVQHLVTLALGGGFNPQDIVNEIRSTHSFRHLTDTEWTWALDFVTHGGPTLRAYPQYNKVTIVENHYEVASREIARLHRMSIGTITSDSLMTVCFTSGKHIGTVEESFIAKLRKGEYFLFAGQVVEIMQIRDMKVYVRKASAAKHLVPRWLGGSFPLSSELADAVRVKLEQARKGEYNSVEMQSIHHLLELQKQWSTIPARDELLIENTHTRDGYHFFVFPFAGRLVHEGLSALIAYRLTLREPRSINVMANDYGFSLITPTPLELNNEEWRTLISEENLIQDILACVNSAELSKRQFRQIARVAGLVFSGYPSQQKTVKQLQASSSMIYDVFKRYDPENLLLEQAQCEVMENQMEITRLKSLLRQISNMKFILQKTERFTPLAFPIWAESVRTQLSSESWTERIQRMVLQLEKVATGKEKKRKTTKA